MALVINPDLAEAYSARGNAYLRQKQYSLAGADFRRAYELEPLDDQAITGVAIIQAIEGEWEQALEFVSGQAKRFRRNPYFAYNTACVCGRAIEYLQKQPSSATRDENIKRLQQAAVDHLRDAVEYGFEQFDWMQRDPDLATLRDLPDFKSLGRSR